MMLGDVDNGCVCDRSAKPPPTTHSYTCDSCKYGTMVKVTADVQHSRAYLNGSKFCALTSACIHCTSMH
eukprot:9208-Heterococcus_DN1.PRE.2